MSYVRRIHEEAVRLADEARAILSCDPLDNDAIAFQVDECVRRVRRMEEAAARGPGE